MAGSHSDKSMAEYVPEAGWRYVLEFWFMRDRLLLLMIFSSFLPFMSVLLLPHMMLWLLKSPSRMYGLGSCSIILLTSASFMGSCGGIYMEQMLIVLCKVVFTAIACNVVSRVILL